MSANDVNEQFPVMKYKYWISVYAEERLATTASRSIPKLELSCTDRPMPSPVQAAHWMKESPHSGPIGALTPKMAMTKDGKYEADLHVGIERQSPENQWPSTGKGLQQMAVVREGEGQNEPILPRRQASEPGGPCSICLDPLECDDYIRALACGHVFHVACVDAWLISRRAFCPLCKAEYHSRTHRRSANNFDASGYTNLGLHIDHFNLPRRLRAALLRREGGSLRQAGA